MPSNIVTIGLKKVKKDNYNILITPTANNASRIFNYGVDYVAMECSKRVDLINLKTATSSMIPVIADIADIEHAKIAEQCGVKAITTALSGYINNTPPIFAEPDLKLVEKCAKTLKIPVIAEGRYWTREHVRSAKDAGAYAVCIGSAICNPDKIARRFHESWK